MVTSSIIPDEANEPPEPPPLRLSTTQQRTRPGDQLHLSTGLRTGGPVGNSEAEKDVEKDVEKLVVSPSDSEKSQQAVSPPKPVANLTVSYDYASGAKAPQSFKFSPTAASVDSPNSNSFFEKPLYQGDNTHQYTPTEVSKSLGVDLKHGLSKKDAEERLARDGPNTMEEDEGVGLWRVLVRQVSNSLTLVLVIAMTLSYATTDFIEGSVISAVILLNIIVGFVQDYRAEKTMQSLHSLSAPLANVVRDNGRLTREKAESLVVGDIVKVCVGDIIPADLRLFDGMNLEIDEALLTGESLPIVKTPSSTLTWGIDVPVGDRTNMAYASSTVTKGRGMGIVVKVGMKTEIGKIAALLRDQGPKENETLLETWKAAIKRTSKNVLGLIGTPLQVKLSKFAILLFGFAIVLAIIVFSANKWQLNNQVVIYGICVAVAVIPESLIAVLTITMAVGTKTMARGNVIVRKMQALEAVGGVTNICSDKTGTLTQGKMVAKKAYIPEIGLLMIEDTNSPFDPTSGVVKHKECSLGRGMSEGTLVSVGSSEFTAKSPQMQRFLNAIALCNLSTVTKSNTDSTTSEKSEDIGWTATGEPTEVSLQVLAMRFSHGKQDLIDTGFWNLVAEHPFDSTIKKMSVVYENKALGTLDVFAKGASEVIVPTLNMVDSDKDQIISMAERLAGEGLRVLCIAYKSLPLGAEGLATATKRSESEQGLNFAGLVGLYDPPRVETKDAVRRCQIAGVKVHMLTGDHIRTATAIAHEVGILSPAIPAADAATMVMTAGQFDALTKEEVDNLPQLPLVIARCSPTTKVRMVEALHRRGAFCVMTGDGVNDSPALKRADVGIAMGMNGSDVAKDASDLVLADDNFASIVRAVEEGRRLFDNIQKFTMHLLISNISQVVLLLIGLVFRDNDGISVFPLSPLEILWVNMITSSFLALGLGLEEAQPDIMLRPPHDLRAGVFTWEVITDKTIYGVFMGALCLASFVLVVYGVGSGNLGEKCNEMLGPNCDTVYRARATVFAVLSFLLLLTAWEVKHFSRSLFNLDPTRYKGQFSIIHAIWYNRFLFWAVVAGFIITFPVIYVPVFNTVVFHHKPISWEWGIVFGCAVVYLALVESWKAIKRRFKIGTGAHAHLTMEDIEARNELGAIMDLDRLSYVGTATVSTLSTRTNTLVDETDFYQEKDGKGKGRGL